MSGSNTWRADVIRLDKLEWEIRLLAKEAPAVESAGDVPDLVPFGLRLASEKAIGTLKRLIFSNTTREQVQTSLARVLAEEATWRKNVAVAGVDFERAAQLRDLADFWKSTAEAAASDEAWERWVTRVEVRYLRALGHLRALLGLRPLS